MRSITNSDREDEFGKTRNLEERRVVTLCAELLRRTEKPIQAPLVSTRVNELEKLI